MAFIGEDDEDVVGGSGLPPGGGAGGVPAAPGGTRSGSFVPLSAYLQANQGAGQRLAGQLAAPLAQREQEISSIIPEATRNPEEAGPGLLGRISDVEAQRGLLGTEGGRMRALRDLQRPGATFGQTTLNNLLLGTPASLGQGADLRGQLRGAGETVFDEMRQGVQGRRREAEAAATAERNKLRPEMRPQFGGAMDWLGDNERHFLLQNRRIMNEPIAYQTARKRREQNWRRAKAAEEMARMEGIAQGNYQDALARFENQAPITFNPADYVTDADRTRARALEGLTGQKYEWGF